MLTFLQRGTLPKPCSNSYCSVLVVVADSFLAKKEEQFFF